MNSKFDLSYAEKQLVFDIRRNYDTYSSKFKSATSEQDKCKLLIINPAYAAFFTDPEPKTIKSFGWVFRKYFRLQQGDVPDHVKDVVIKSDPRWIGYMDELNIKHQLSIAKKHPSLVYKWPDLFSLKVLNKIDSGYKVCLDTYASLGLPDKELDKRVKAILKSNTQVINAVELPLVIK